MEIGDYAYGGIYAGDHDSRHIICSPIEYDLPFRVDWRQATEYCKSIGMGLPTKEELMILCELYKQRPDYFPKRGYHWYWSSTESSSTNAWTQYFGNGYQDTFNKTGDYYVRAVRRVEIDTRSEN